MGKKRRRRTMCSVMALPKTPARRARRVRWIGYALLRLGKLLLRLTR